MARIGRSRPVSNYFPIHRTKTASPVTTAGVAAATATALDASVAVGVPAGRAATTAAALNASPGVGVVAGVATTTASAKQPTISLAFFVGFASVTATAQPPGGAISFGAGRAQATAAALGAVGGVGATPTRAQATATAYNIAKVAIGVPAGLVSAQCDVQQNLIFHGTPDERTIYIPFESRSYVVDAENRKLIVSQD